MWLLTSRRGMPASKERLPLLGQFVMKQAEVKVTSNRTNWATRAFVFIFASRSVFHLIQTRWERERERMSEWVISFNLIKSITQVTRMNGSFIAGKMHTISHPPHNLSEANRANWNIRWTMRCVLRVSWRNREREKKKKMQRRKEWVRERKKKKNQRICQMVEWTVTQRPFQPKVQWIFIVSVFIEKTVSISQPAQHVVPNRGERKVMDGCDDVTGSLSFSLTHRLKSADAGDADAHAAYRYTWVNDETARTADQLECRSNKWTRRE